MHIGVKVCSYLLTLHSTFPGAEVVEKQDGQANTYSKFGVFASKIVSIHNFKLDNHHDPYPILLLPRKHNSNPLWPFTLDFSNSRDVYSKDWMVT